MGYFVNVYVLTVVLRIDFAYSFV